MGRRGGLLLLASRFAYGLRIAIPAACGALGMGVVTFTLLDLVAGVLWAVPMAALGFFAGGALGPLLEGVRRYEEAVALLLVVAVAALLGRPARAARRPLARAAVGRPPRARAVRGRPHGRAEPAVGHLAPRAGGDAGARAVAARSRSRSAAAP